MTEPTAGLPVRTTPGRPPTCTVVLPLPPPWFMVSHPAQGGASDDMYSIHILLVNVKCIPYNMGYSTPLTGGPDAPYIPEYDPTNLTATTRHHHDQRADAPHRPVTPALLGPVAC